MMHFLKLSRFALLIAVCWLSACSDNLVEEASLPEVETTTLVSLTDDVSLENNYLKFASPEAFESFLGEENEDKKVELINRIKEVSFTSWQENFLASEEQLAPNGRTEAEDILIEDEYISSLMNEDGVLQIGQYLFKINVNQELVFALNESDKNHYDELVAENDKNEKIMVFTTSDDVLPMLAEGSTGTVENAREAGLTCKQSQARAASRGDDVYYGAGNDYRLNCVTRYVKLGVYFKLMAKTRNQFRMFGIWVEQVGNLEISTDAGWKPRCRSTSYKNDIVREPVRSSIKRVVYEKIKGLNKYYYRAQYSNTAAGVTSTVFEIRDNW
jgi:hypothetical protein